MARINIEECWWSDPRRSKLIRLFQGDTNQADGLAVTAWRLAQEFWKNGKQLIPVAHFESIEANSKLIEANLAEARTDGIYIRGSSQYLEWVADRKRAASEGGKKSAAARRKKDGSAQPKSRSKPEANSNQNEASSNQTQPSVSGSPSSSGSSSGSSCSAGESAAAPPSQEKTPAPVSVFIGTYVKAYQKRYGEKARPDLSKKVLGQIEKFLVEKPMDRACRLIETYCEMNDSWFFTKAYDFGTFLENQSKVGLMLDTGQGSTQLQGKQAEKVDACKDQLRRIEEGDL